MSNSFFSQDFGASQATFDVGITETQLGSQLDWSFLDIGTQDVPGFSDFDLGKARAGMHLSSAHHNQTVPHQGLFKGDLLSQCRRSPSCRTPRRWQQQWRV